MREYPVRLVEDPEVPGELRDALRAELDRPVLGDLPALRARALTRPSSGWGWGLALGGLVGAGLWLGMGAADRPIATPVVTASATPVSGSSVPASAPVGTAPILDGMPDPVTRAAPGSVTRTSAGRGGPGRVEAMTAAGPAPMTAAGPAPMIAAEPAPMTEDLAVTETLAADAAIARVSAPTVGAAPAADAPSRLRAQLDAYDAGRRLAKAGRSQEALDAFDAWRATWPDGALRAEVDLSRVDLLLQMGRVVEAESSAAAMLAGGTSGAVTAELNRVRAQSLVALDRCDEALDLVDGLASEVAAAVRKSCRRGR